jgi:DNA polymerase III epsilon subunit-like protein
MSAIIWDFETEGLNLALTRPWQLAYIKSENGKILDRKNIYIDVHDLQISDDAARVTGFSWEKYHKNKRPAEEVVELIKKEFIQSKSILAGHNILGYDIYILRNLFEYVGEKLDFNDFIYRVIDTLCLARGKHFEVEVPSEEKERLSFMYKMLHRYDKSFKGSLSAVAKNNNIEFDPTRLHDAMYDVELNNKVYERLIYGTEIPR